MWGKNQKSSPEAPASPPTAPSVALPESPRREAAPVREPQRESAAIARIGAGLSIQGEIRGSEDLRIDGEVHGSVRLENATVTVGKQGRVHADVEAREIVVEGRVEGSLAGRERVRISASGNVRGDVRTQRIAIDDGAILRGAVDIVRPGEARPVPPAKSYAASATVAPLAPQNAAPERANVNLTPEPAEKLR